MVSTKEREMEYTDQEIIDGTGASIVGADSRAHVEERKGTSPSGLCQEEGLRGGYSGGGKQNTDAGDSTSP